MDHSSTESMIGNSPATNDLAGANSHTSGQVTADVIQNWLVSYLANLLEVKESEIDITASFDIYGLDSSATIGLTSDLGDRFKLEEIDPTITYDYSTIQALAEYLAQ